MGRILKTLLYGLVFLMSTGVFFSNIFHIIPTFFHVSSTYRQGNLRIDALHIKVPASKVQSTKQLENVNPNVLYTSTPTYKVKTTQRQENLSLNIPHSPKLMYKELKSLTKSVARKLNKARKHARGMKTSSILFSAIDDVKEMMEVLHISYDKVTRRKTKRSTHVCQEYYTDTKHGFPLYETGYETKKCKYATPVEKIVSIVLLFNTKQINNAEKVLQNIYDQLNQPTVLVGFYGDATELRKKYASTQIEQLSSNITIGKAWNKLVSYTKTIYVLIGRDITQFDKDARLDRLVREMEILNVPVAGGSTRNTNHIWNIGCYQRAFRNYSILYEDGYDESIHDCLFCDHMTGPFVTRTDVLKRIQFDENIINMGLFEDLFLQINQEMVVCPDSMFYTNSSTISDDPKHWRQFATKRKLFTLKVPEHSSKIQFDCNQEYPVYGWSNPKTFSNHPCRLEDLVKLIGDVMDICKEFNLICEIIDGTMIGVLKFNGILPWEQDADAKFHVSNYTAITSLKSVFQNRGFTLIRNNVTKPCAQIDYTDRFFDILRDSWRLDFNAYCSMDTFDLKNSGIHPTVVRLHDRYVYGPRNPALATRNKYPYVFGHSEHYHITDIGIWGIYKKHKFRKCENPGRHDCLDQYFTDGNLQFRILSP